MGVIVIMFIVGGGVLLLGMLFSGSRDHRDYGIGSDGGGYDSGGDGGGGDGGGGGD